MKAREGVGRRGEDRLSRSRDQANPVEVRRVSLKSPKGQGLDISCQLQSRALHVADPCFVPGGAKSRSKPRSLWGFPKSSIATEGVKEAFIPENDWTL